MIVNRGLKDYIKTLSPKNIHTFFNQQGRLVKAKTLKAVKSREDLSLVSDLPLFDKQLAELRNVLERTQQLLEEEREKQYDMVNAFYLNDIEDRISALQMALNY